MRLLEITNDFPPTVGGIENYILSLVSRWDGEVVVLTREVAGDREFDRGLDYEVIRVPRSTLMPTPELLRRARRVIEERKIDMVHFASPLPLSLLGPRLRQSHGVDYSVSTHGGEFVFQEWLLSGRILLRVAMEAASVILCESRFVEARVRRFFGDETPPPTEYVPAGVDVERFHPGIEPAFRSPSGGPVIACVSRLIARKGADSLIKCLPQVLSVHPDAHLLIVGTGPDFASLQKLAASTGVATSVTFTGPQPWSAVPNFYASADLFAMPTRERYGGLQTEGLPLCYLEAAACGLPVVAGDIGGVRDAVVDGFTGRVVDPRDLGEIAGAINEIIGNPVRARTMGDNARKRVLDEFTWDRSAERFRAALKKYSR